jgi:hypothetical protein
MQATARNLRSAKAESWSVDPVVEPKEGHTRTSPSTKPAMTHLLIVPATQETSPIVSGPPQVLNAARPGVSLEGNHWIDERKQFADKVRPGLFSAGRLMARSSRRLKPPLSRGRRYTYKAASPPSHLLLQLKAPNYQAERPSTREVPGRKKFHSSLILGRFCP